MAIRATWASTLSQRKHQKLFLNVMVKLVRTVNRLALSAKKLSMRKTLSPPTVNAQTGSCTDTVTSATRAARTKADAALMRWSTALGLTLPIAHSDGRILTIDAEPLPSSSATLTIPGRSGPGTIDEMIAVSASSAMIQTGSAQLPGMQIARTILYAAGASRALFVKNHQHERSLSIFLA